MKIINESMSAISGLGVIMTHGEPDSRYLDGTASTPLGFVRVYAQDGHMRLDFIWKGRHHMRTIFKDGMATAQGLRNRATRFAKEISGSRK